MGKNWFKYILAFVSVFALRMIPFRAPNLEPIMAILMPFGKVYGGVSAFLFGSLSIVLFDSMTSGVGIWTIVTAFTYGVIGYGSQKFFKNRTDWKSYATYAMMATIFYDAITGLTIGPLFFHQSFMVSLVGQIPFTLIHLLGNVSFAIVLSPVIEMWAKRSEKSFVIGRLCKAEAVN
jgi:energy-coupling factor transport system substrate-specific component